MRTINPEDRADRGGREWVVCCRVLMKGDVLLAVSHSVTDEYKMKGVEKVKYIAGEEGGVDGQDSTVRDSLVLCVVYFTSVRGHMLCVMPASVYLFVKNVNL